MDPINQVNQGSGSSKKGLYIVIGVLVVLLVGGYLYMRGNFGVKSEMYGVDVDRNIDGSVTYESDYGTVTTDKNKLPDNWPKDVPVYKNATISQSTSSDIAGADGATVTFTTSDDFQTILDFYKKELTASGWVSPYSGKPITGTQAGVITILGAKKGNRNFSLSITTNKDTGKQIVNVGIMTIPDASNYKTGL